MNTLPAVLLARSFLTGRSGKGEKGQRYLLGAVLGVALSLVPLVVVLVVSDGMIEGITARYIETGTYHLQASFTGSGAAPEDPDQKQRTLETLRSLPGIVSVIPETQGPGIALAGGNTANALIRSVGKEFFSDPGVKTYLETVSGSTGDMRGRDAVLGEALARGLGLKTGDSFSLMTAKSYASENNVPELVPKLSFFRVKGIVSAGYRELDSLWLFVNEDSGAKILAPETARFMVGIKVHDPYSSRIDSMRARIESELKAQDSRGGSSWYVRTWPEIEQSLFKSFSTTRALLVLIMAIAVAVAAVNVGSALSMLIVERRQDIAVLKATGASPVFIGLVFLYAGVFTGGIGTIAGLAAGSLLAWRINDIIGLLERMVNIFSGLIAGLSGAPIPASGFRLLDPSFYLSSIPVNFRPGAIALIAALALILCAAVSLLPARKAARLSPLEIVRKV